MIWLHIISDLNKINFKLLDLNQDKLQQFVSLSIKEVWLNKLWDYYYTFWKQDEITWVIALAESHISIHTWPEKWYISLDIFVCNMQNNNSQKAKKLYSLFIELFKPKEIKDKFINRNT